MNQSEQISFHQKCWLCAIAWVTAIFGMTLVEWGYFSWEGILSPPVFSPAGFPVLLVLMYSYPTSSASIVIAAVVGWLYYVILTIWSLRAVRRVVFIRVFVVLCISLLLNIAGCEVMKHGNYRTERNAPASTALESKPHPATLHRFS